MGVGRLPLPSERRRTALVEIMADEGSFKRDYAYLCDATGVRYYKLHAQIADRVCLKPTKPPRPHDRNNSQLSRHWRDIVEEAYRFKLCNLTVNVEKAAEMVRRVVQHVDERARG